MKQTVELNRLFEKDRGKTDSTPRGTVELNHLFRKDLGSPNPTGRPLPSLSAQIGPRLVGVDMLGGESQHAVLSLWHRRRIKTEEKAKFLAFVWGLTSILH